MLATGIVTDVLIIVLGVDAVAVGAVANNYIVVTILTVFPAASVEVDIDGVAFVTVTVTSDCFGHAVAAAAFLLLVDVQFWLQQLVGVVLSDL